MTDNIEVVYTQEHWELLSSLRGEAQSLTRPLAEAHIEALVYGSIALWQGRPLYYAFSENELEVVQASDLDATEVELGRQYNPDFAPHWYSLPRWIWAPLPQDPKTRDSIVTAAVTGGNDVTNMPRYFKPWSQGLPDLRKQLKKVDELRFFSGKQKKALERQMTQLGLSVEEPSTIPMTGISKREASLTAVDSW